MRCGCAGVRYAEAGENKETIMIWIFLFLGLFLCLIAGFLFLIHCIRKFHFVAVLSHDNKTAGLLISCAVCIIPMVLIWVLLGYMNAIIILIHLVVFWGIADWIRGMLIKYRKKEIRYHYTAMAAIVVTILYLGVGALQAYHVWQTDYSITTDKEVGTFRVALFADSHVGTTFDGEGLAKHLARIQEQRPDVVVIAGDFVDEDSTREDMVNACHALGELETPYGVYFVFGNHDKGKYSNGYRGYTGDDLIAELEKNGVMVLQDEAVLIDDRFYLIGRQDASEELDFGGSRADMEELLNGLDKNKFSIVLDHQPRDYEAQAHAGADLVLSGHTHGGQMIPLMQLDSLLHFGGNDNIYGLQHRSDTDYIVTSGISDWAIKFKTGCRSEYVIIDIIGK